MADRTPIEWTDATWNVITGCTRVDEGCRNCYAEIMAARFSKPGQWGNGLARIVTANGKSDHRWTGKMRFNPRALDQPLRWRKPRRIFVNSTSDMFHDSVPDDWIDQVFAVMARCPRHVFQILTKRPERMRDYLTAAHAQVPRRSIGHSMIWPNVWLGTSISDQASADARIPALLECPAAVRFLSAEPLLGPMDLHRWMGVHHHPDNNTDDPETLAAINAIIRAARNMFRKDHGGGIDWVICGGESGPGARPMHPDWARSLRDQCVAAGVAFFFKQWGEWGPSTPDEAAGNPRSGWRCLAGHPHVPRATELYPEAGAAFIERKGKARAGRLLDGRTWDQMPGGTE